MTKAWIVATLAVAIVAAGCDSDARLVQKSRETLVEQETPGTPNPKLPALPPDKGIPSSSQEK